MSNAYAINQKGGTYYLTLTVISWVDVFSRKRHRDILLDSLAHCRLNKGLQLHAWVIMTNHLHLIASTADDEQMPNVPRAFKSRRRKP